MPPKGRRDPALLEIDGAPGADLSPEEIEQHTDQPADARVVPTLMYDGEILQTSMTLAVLLPGDSKESYFGSRFVGIKQPHESDEDVATRGITMVRETVLGQLDDAIDAVSEFATNLQQSGRLPS